MDVPVNSKSVAKENFSGWRKCMRASNSITKVSLDIYCALRCTFDVILQWRASNQQLIGARKAEERFIELTVGILESMRLVTIRC